MTEQEAYKVLGVGVLVTSKELKKEYRKLVKKHHPDKGGEGELFIKIQKAYEILKEKTKEYVEGELTHETIFDIRRKAR